MKLSILKVIPGLTLLCAILLGLAPAIAQDKPDLPDWIMHPPDSPTGIRGFGSGDTKLDAIAVALGELSAKIDTVESSTIMYNDSLITKASSSTRFGKVRVWWITKDFTVESDGSDSDFSQRICKVNLGDSLNYYQIKSFEEMSSINGEDRSETYIEATGKNLRFKNLLDELKTAGVEIKTFETEDIYWVLMVYGRENLKK